MRGNSTGVQFNDRVLAGEVRTLTLNEIKKVLKKGKGSLYGSVLVKLAGTILPRLNEHTGEDGKPMVIEISSSVAKKYGINATSNKNS